MDTPSQIVFCFLDGHYPNMETAVPQSNAQVQHLPSDCQKNSQNPQNSSQNDNDTESSESHSPNQSQKYRMDVPTRKRFAEIIQEMRADRSYRSFARLLSVTHPTIKAWENLEGIPDVENLERIAQFRGETLEEFKQFLAGERTASQLQELVKQVRTISKEELAVVLQVIAERIAS
ncbi:helix-turn-helix domain-containing protein [Microcoleus asticus]|uniref:HTH cro/C1-type domain-containing protein n=1 Tax=Microcoleus asticus IPMA8 TaxID=2563858 RepID=A0ABX2D276_9CYAN|nr:helix-turn-helix transcriptional regulator [Microcoleus asticus]NQE36734.1 hypothetical protein [Microcoleus asticus IPMA8]